MTLLQRPDLSDASSAVRAYIEALESELANLRLARAQAVVRAQADDTDLDRSDLTGEPSEPPTTFSIITATAGGIIKRTPRHLYERQRRGGMGIFDLDAPDGDPPALLAIADLNQSLIVMTNQGRTFPLAVSMLAESPIRGRGEALHRWMPLQPNERVAWVVPDLGRGYLNMVTTRGWVRRWRYNIFGRALMPGTLLYDLREGGPPATACWTSGDGDLFIATAKGQAIRFAETQIPVRGCSGMRVDPDDVVIGAAGVREAGGVFLLAADGKGAIRQMNGFAQNKAPGSGGKLAMKSDRLIGVAAVSEADDIFAISRLGKIIRFRAAEVPPKEGVVQGVNCMALRGDEAAVVAACAL